MAYYFFLQFAGSTCNVMSRFCIWLKMCFAGFETRCSIGSTEQREEKPSETRRRQKKCRGYTRRWLHRKGQPRWIEFEMKHTFSNKDIWIGQFIHSFWTRTLFSTSNFDFLYRYLVIINWVHRARAHQLTFFYDNCDLRVTLSAYLFSAIGLPCKQFSLTMRVMRV